MIFAIILTIAALIGGIVLTMFSFSELDNEFLDETWRLDHRQVM